QADLVAEDANLSRVKAEGWLTLESAETVFRMGGLGYDSLKRAAASRAFVPVPLGVTASLRIENRIQRSTSRNVLARLPGRERPEEVVVYMAHWDHLGIDPSLEGDSIYNGAHDNASGTAALIELGEAFSSLDEAPERSILLLAVTAEEDGLLGSKHYAADPVYPLENTVGAINLDAMKNLWGPTRDVTVVGHGMSELEQVLATAAEAQGRRLRPDSEPEKGFFYRSDHFEFAKRGVPALYMEGGIDYVEGGEEYGHRMRREWTEQRYHKPADEFDESWNLEGAIQDLRLLFRVGYRLANGEMWPEWYEGTEFRATREAMMADGASGTE
ncbi:MAG: M28 family metallopeptidase, partial [Gemmatimonadota bacterium]|nr:M28 family metallopeptidase [Gemmatimonadota bacterium]